MDTRATIDMAVAGIEASGAATGTLGAGIVMAVAESATPVAEIQPTVVGVESTVAVTEAAVAVFLRPWWEVKRR